jgi:hypothetical protein
MKTNYLVKYLKLSLAIIAMQMISCEEFIFAQNTCNSTDSIQLKNKYGIGLLPSKAKNIFGIAIGPIGSECFCYLPYTRNSYGLNIQLGQGIFQTFMIKRWNLDSYTEFIDSLNSVEVLQKNDALLKKVVHNGILLSVFGTFSDQINGISCSIWMSSNRIVNGLSFNLLWNIQQKINGAVIGIANTSIKTNGVQVGIFNKSNKLRGFQFGIWNVNENRSLPLINWNFK